MKESEICRCRRHEYQRLAGGGWAADIHVHNTCTNFTVLCDPEFQGDTIAIRKAT